MSSFQERLDEEKVETLRAWGEGLRTDPRDEVRAAGRAITMLVEEIERLNVDLWNARAAVRDAPVAAPAVAPVEAREVPGAAAAAAEDAPRRALPPPLPAY
ncbi:MAG: hypothetical protein ACRDM1_07360 [Gaiellaceae bacterium]